MSPPAAEGIPYGEMGGARTEIYRDRTHLLVYAFVMDLIYFTIVRMRFHLASGMNLAIFCNLSLRLVFS